MPTWYTSAHIFPSIVDGCVEQDLGAELHRSHDIAFEDKVFTTEAQGSRHGDNEKKGCAHVHAQVMRPCSHNTIPQLQ